MITVPEGYIVVAKAGEQARMLPLFQHRRQAAE
jgi:hypothetical protein